MLMMEMTETAFWGAPALAAGSSGSAVLSQHSSPSSSMLVALMSTNILLLFTHRASRSEESDVQGSICSLITCPYLRQITNRFLS